MKLQEILDDHILKLNKSEYYKLKNAIKTGSVTWVLGAGISVPAGLPQWEELLAKMWARLTEIEYGMASKSDEAVNEFAKARRERLERIREYSDFRTKVKNANNGKYKYIFANINVLESAEYLWNYIGDVSEISDATEELGKQVWKALLRDALSINKDKKKLKKLLSNQAVGRLAMLLSDQKIGNVITYNYDDILEFCLQEIGNMKDTDVNVVCDCDKYKGEDRRKINIYHPHGALKIVGSALGKESDNIILTESSYYQMEQKAYIWENSVQARALVETGCVFMGFSGEDYNFRRIIKNIGFQPQKERPRHYIFFCIDNLVQNIYGAEVKKRYQEKYITYKGMDEYNEEERKELQAVLRKEIIDSEEFVYEGVQLINMLYARYSYWKRHGIIPIWSTYEELPKMIMQLRD